MIRAQWLIAVLGGVAVACSGALAPGSHDEGTPDAAEEASTQAVSCDAGCPDGSAEVSWYVTPTQASRCECAPEDALRCEPVIGQPSANGPVGPAKCQCAICGPEVQQSWECKYDPYYGNVIEVSCQ
jgi:hypothetical protein